MFDLNKFVLKCDLSFQNRIENDKLYNIFRKEDPVMDNRIYIQLYLTKYLPKNI